MNTATNYAQLFYSKSADLAELKKNVKDNPASVFARFLLLLYYKENNDPEFENLTRQSALHFNNFHWLQFQLFQSDLEKKDLHINQYSSESKGHFAVSFPENGSGLVAGDKENIPGEIEDKIPSSEEMPEINNTTQETQEITATVKEDKSISTDKNLESSASHDSFTEEKPEVAFEPKEAVLEADQEINNAPFINNTGQDVAFGKREKESKNEEPTKAINFSGQLTSNTDSSVDANAELIPFEPLHTVDYFASQGIKIIEEALAEDKLGKQVKSFTAWLKSMKRLHPGKLPEQNDVIEKIIQSSAEQSNADADVLTEAMAEVLVKQNKTEKAIEMYQKLSLLNPSKSAYFAAKIESLKTN